MISVAEGRKEEMCMAVNLPLTGSRRQPHRKSVFDAAQHKDILLVISQELVQVTLVPGLFEFLPGSIGPLPVLAGQGSFQSELTFNRFLASPPVGLPTQRTQVDMLEFLVQNDSELSGDDGEVKSRVAPHRVGNRPPIVSDDVLHAFERLHQNLLRYVLSHKLEERIAATTHDQYSDDRYLVIFVILEQSLVPKISPVAGLDVEVGFHHVKSSHVCLAARFAPRRLVSLVERSG